VGRMDELEERFDLLDRSIANLRDDLENIREEEKEEEFVTVIDGWRGSLKLKECWVRVGANLESMEDLELLARKGEWFFCLAENGVMKGHRNLKFKPFSKENPPPVDWPVELPDGAVRYTTGHMDSKNHIHVFQGGRTSTSTLEGQVAVWAKYKFLNLGKVE